MADQDNTKKELEILVGITPEKYAKYQGRNLNAYEMVFVSSSANSDASPATAENEIRENALSKNCEVILNLIPNSAYEGNRCLRTYLVGLGLRLKVEEP